jgi:diadenosine tetraphosphatase ApaH/serine/threonine PP2A family protein phosphatase
MRILIISDIHANLTALRTVLTDAGSVGATWCLGDLVGYGPDPEECVERVRRIPNFSCLIGNHDAAVLGQVDIASFNPEARQAIQWTHHKLSAASKDYLRSLPERLVINSATLAHGSPRHPIWEYLLDVRAATQNFNYFETPYCFVGHSHLPVIFQLSDGQKYADLIVPEAGLKIELVARAIINPGSVGQPRDRNPRAAYAIYDTEENTLEYRRVAYEISEVQARMQQAGLPARHIQRLTSGW